MPNRTGADLLPDPRKQSDLSYKEYNTMKPGRTTTTSRPAPTQVTKVPNPQDEIRRCAYELYEQRGRVDRHELDDWLQAESRWPRRSRRE
ncbi:MAG: DUF2934 domain-containing protein [Acidobacteriia bacterium]|nr:DUF2934 domain-containing protein [Terriglobia bacterium]